jgi:rod shape-determining protein MreC
MELLRVQDQMDGLLADTVAFRGFTPDSTEVFDFDFISAEVVSNSISSQFNYITINKGKADGIAPDMGVVSSKGVVGIVSVVSDHYAVILPVLNPKFRLSCKVLRSNNFGSLTWNGRDPRMADLEELPRHVVFQKGDTVVTSGYSAIFPSGIRVGTIAAHKKQRDDNFYTLEVLLATDFTSLQHVRIINNKRQKEQIEVEQEAKRND